MTYKCCKYGFRRAVPFDVVVTYGPTKGIQKQIAIDDLGNSQG